MIRFYAPEIETTFELPETESGHCCRVLRFRAGDIIQVVDGKGHSFDCEIVEANPKHTPLSIIKKSIEYLHWNPIITLAVAPTKNMDRMEWLAEKAVEIGINKLIFVDCEHNVRHTLKYERIEKILISAMKQSLKSRLPEFEGIVPIGDFLTGCNSSSKFMGYCSDNIIRKEFSGEYDGISDVTILIGPEGDFSIKEVQYAVDCGFIPVSFGNTRLRTETAALYALCSAHTLITQKQSLSL